MITQTQNTSRLPGPPWVIEMESGGSLVVGLEYMSERFLISDEGVTVLIIVVVITVEVGADGMADGSAIYESAQLLESKF